MRIRANRIVVLAVLLVPGACAPGQQAEPVLQILGGSVTYVSGSSAYIGVGRERGVQAGDTVTFMRRGVAISAGTVAAVSARSSVVPIAGDGTKVSIGDSVTIRSWRRPEPAAGTPGGRTRAAGSLMEPPGVSGRAALQYFGTRDGNAGMASSLPAVLLQLSVPALFGTGVTFTFHGRATRELGGPEPLMASRSRSNVRVYELAFSSQAPGNRFGFSLGRVTSRYVAGLGPVDGAEAFVRAGNLTAGVLGGFQPDYSNSGLDMHRQKAALFVNYGWRRGQNSGGDVSLAYGRIMFNGRLDRDFLYLQSSTRLGGAFFLYQSTEVDVMGLEGETRKGKPRLTNTFVSASYAPLAWLTVDAGYDATRAVYYLESMNLRSDTLLDNTLRQGIRGGVAVRLPLRIQLGARVHVRPAVAELPPSRTVVGTLRMANIAGTGASLGVQASDIRGVYATGLNVSAHAEYGFASGTVISAAAERYGYTLLRSEDRQTSTTASIMAHTMIGRRWYILGGIDQVWENNRSLQRVFGEIGIRF